MDRSGKILELRWIEGLHGPNEMAISGNSHFIADIDALVEANIETGQIINKFELEGEPRLNNVTVSADGEVFVSGSGSNLIYRVEDGALTEIFAGDDGERFNGLYVNLTEMNYWLSEFTNLSECAEPLIKMANELSETGKSTACEHYILPGWVATTIPPFSEAPRLSTISVTGYG